MCKLYIVEDAKDSRYNEETREWNGMIRELQDQVGC